MIELQGRIALVMGGAGGMGAASCQALAAHGAIVIVADRDGDAAERAASAIVGSGGEAIAYRVDVSSMDEIRDLFDHVARTYGRLNVLFSNVGVTGPNSFDVTEVEFDQVFNVNLKAHFFATNLAAPLMRACAPQASIIYMSSGAAYRSGGRSPLYAISKSAILMMTRTFARHLGPDGIRVNAVCPGHVRTDFPRKWLGVDDETYDAMVENSSRGIPLGRIGVPSDVAGVVAFLASDQSAYLTGVSIPIDGGQSA